MDSNPEELICWNCGNKTLVYRNRENYCQYCNVPLRSPYDTVIKQERKDDNNRVIRLRDGIKIIAEIKQKDLEKVIKNEFELKKFAFEKEPYFLVERPTDGIDEKFNNLLNSSQKLFDGLVPVLTPVYGQYNYIIIRYKYIKSNFKRAKFRSILLFIITVLMIFIAGIYGYTQLNNENTGLFGLNTSSSAILYAIQFTTILVILMIIKDIIPIIQLKNKGQSIISYWIPAPPVFELGTFGSILFQTNYSHNRKELINTAFWGPFVSWVLSVLIFIITLSWGQINPQLASNYASYSILENGKFEPIILKLIQLFSGNKDPITIIYIMHPITLAAFGSIYINGLSLLPVSHLNGGYISRGVIGELGHQFLTFVFVVILFSSYWLFAVILISANIIIGTPKVLNGVSKITRREVIMFFIALIISILSIPVNIAN